MPTRDVVIRIKGDIGDLQAKLATIGHSMGNAADKFTAGTKEAAKMRQGLNDLGNTAGKIGLVAAAGIAVAIKAFSDFDEGMSRVEAATHASGAEMAQLRALALDAGAATKFSATEAAEGIEELAKAGVATADILNGGLQGALDLAAAGTIDVGFAAETAATAMNQFGLAGDQVPHIADLLAAAAGKAQGEVSDMAMALKQGGLVADQVGLSIEETTGALGAFASAGLLGSDAGTSFKTMLGALTPNSAKAAKTMNALGLSAFDAQGSFVGLTEFAGDLRAALVDMTDQQRQATLETIFGSDAVRAAAILYDQGAAGMQSWIDKVNDQGFAAETAAIKMDNLKGDLERLRGSLETLFTETGENSNDFLRGATQGAESFVNTLAGLPPWVDKTALSLAGITAVLGGGLWFTSKVINGVSDMRAAFENLNLSARQTDIALGAAKTAAVGLAVYMGGQFIDSLDDANLSARQLKNAIDDLAAGRDAEQLANLTIGADSLTDALANASGELGFWGSSLRGSFFGVGDAINYFTSAGDEVEQIDEYIASLAETDLSRARDAFRTISDEWVASGRDLDTLLDLFPQYQVALDNAAEASWDATVGQRAVNNALEDSPGASRRSADAFGDVADAAGDAGEATEDFNEALKRVQGTLKGRSDIRAYEESLDAFTARLKERKDLLGELAEAQDDLNAAETPDERKRAQDRIDDLNGQLKDYKFTLDETTQAGRDWQASLDEIANNALVAAESMDELDRPQYLNQARRDFVDAATKLGLGKDAAKALADELGLLHHTVASPKIEIDDKPARLTLDQFKQEFYGLKPKTVALHLQLTGAKQLDQLERFGHNIGADGSTVPKDGGPYADRYAYLLAPGEEVISNRFGQADRWRPLLKAINAGRLADGGTAGRYAERVQTSRVTNYYGGGAEIDYDRLAGAMAKGRQLYGDVHVHGDGSFRRELERDERREAVGGFNFNG